MDSRAPITVAITRFEDLLALGLQAALASDPSMSVVATDIVPERIAVTLRAHHPQVLILDLAALRDAAQVRELRDEHPATHLVLIGERLSGVESAQLLAFGACACLGRDTQARDLRHAVHLGSRGLQLQLMPIDAGETPVRESHLTAREGLERRPETVDAPSSPNALQHLMHQLAFRRPLVGFPHPERGRVDGG